MLQSKGVRLRPGDFVEARRRLEGKESVRREKLTTLPEAARLIKDGDQIAIGGCLYSRTPLALLMEVLRQERRGLTLSRNLMCYEGEWFMAAGAVDKIVTSWFGIGLPWGISRVMREAVEGGHVQFEEWSHLALGLRFRAAAMGVPFLPTPRLLGMCPGSSRCSLPRIDEGCFRRCSNQRGCRDSHRCLQSRCR